METLTVCSCRYSKSSAWVRSKSCVWQIWDNAEKWTSFTEPIHIKLDGKQFIQFSLDSCMHVPVNTRFLYEGLFIFRYRAPHPISY
jgi:hypothetical protein